MTRANPQPCHASSMTPATLISTQPKYGIRRSNLRAGRLNLKTVATEDNYRKTRVSKHRTCRLNPADAEQIAAADGNLVELDAAHAAPLRAWLIIDPTVTRGTVPLDAAGAGMLLINTGANIVVRRLGHGRPVPSTND